MRKKVTALSVAAVAGAAILAAATTAACESTHTAGHPVSATTSAPSTAALDTGNYPTKPRPPLGASETAARGSLREAQRLANFTTDPWEVDPQLTTPLRFGPMRGGAAIKGPDGYAIIFASHLEQKLTLDSFVNGFVTGRELPDQRSLTNAVLRFSDPDAASAAAHTLAQFFIDHPLPLPPPIPTTPIQIPGHPDAVATTNLWYRNDVDKTYTVVNAFTPHGPLLLVQRVQLIGPDSDATAIVAKTLDVQGPAVDGYNLVDTAQFPSVPLDPSGLLARALPLPNGAGTTNSNMTVNAHGYIHFDSRPATASKNLADAGVDVVVSAGGWIFQARDAPAANALVNAYVTDMQVDGPVSETVPGLAGSHCQTGAGHDSVTCVAPAGRYMFEVSGNTLKDARQQAGAQYLLLTAP